MTTKSMVNVIELCRQLDVANFEDRANKSRNSSTIRNVKRMQPSVGGTGRYNPRVMILCLRMVGAVVLVFLANVCLAASPGSWSGVVHDGTGSPIAGAQIALNDHSGKTVFTTTTTPAGEFTFSDIAPAKYGIVVTTASATFKSANAIEINDGSHLKSNLKLSASGMTVVVDQEPGATNSQASGGERLSRSEVSSLPLNSRDFSKLLLLAAGTMTDANGAANFTQQFAVNGQRGSTTVFAMDGADTTDPEMGGATFSNFNVDAIQEVQSSSGVMLPEVGHGAAGYTNVVTRSGSDAIHGSLFEFFRNASLDARNYFDHVGLDQRRIPEFIRNEFGGAIGGPVVLPVYNGRGHTFFFGEYQGFRQILGTTQVFPVPTADERLGIDTATFPGDTLTVPVNPAIKPVLDAYPSPNDPNGPYGDRTFATSSKVS
ncbi:MAG TPA: carboxypeptidase-like regulatory domain-containing protein, partial [Terriglobales bacterium]|nr:carboxypeptidase-like regulatory domain-containing protein [Terriglobales bacterium]